MSEEYQKLKESLGIDVKTRIDTNFNDSNHVTVSRKLKPKAYLNYRSTTKHTAESLGVGQEDLSHLNPKRMDGGDFKTRGQKK